jgi:secretory lipase
LSEIGNRGEVISNPSLKRSLTGVAIVLSLVALLADGSVLAQQQATSQVKPPRGVLPITRFYDTPAPFPPGKPGELIRSQEFDGYYLGEDVSAVRILYHSRSGNGEDVVTSGVVIVPDRKPPAGGWPIVAWAHEWTGTARQCAPSLMRSLGSGPFLSMYASLGYAVVATDYAGLGTNFRNAFVDIPSNALDVIYSVPAARAAQPSLGSKWIAMGQADGGLAALGVAEAESEIRDPGYLGSIAMSGAANMKDAYEKPAQGTSQPMLAFLAYGIKTVFPQFQPSDVLTEKGLSAYRQIESSCAVASNGTMPASEIVKPNWEKNGLVQEFFRRNTLGQKRAGGPLLVLGAESDPAVIAGMTSRLVGDLCKQGDRVQFIRYPGLDSGAVLGGSVRDQIGWIQSRFKGEVASSYCQ